VGSRQQYGAVAVEFILNSNSIRFQMEFKSLGTSSYLKWILNLKQNKVVKVLKKGTSFFIGTSSYSKWILN
jgi:hypothetical protein